MTNTIKKLQEIADRLNKGKKIDWFNDEQDKYSIAVIHKNNECWIDTYWSIGVKQQGTIYCLNEEFARIAMKEIGKKELLEYLGVE